MLREPILEVFTMDYPPMRGGVARYLSSLVQVSEGLMHVSVPMEHDNPSATQVPFWWSGWPKWLPLINSIRKSKHRVLVSHVLPVGTAACIAKALGGPDFYVLFHGTDLKRIDSRWRLWLLRSICQDAKGLVVNSQATGRALAKLYPLAKPLVLTPGVSGFGHIDKQAARTNLGLGSADKIILTVCRLVERKGVDVLLQSLAEIRDLQPECKLTVIGQGPYAPSLHALSAVLKLDEAVRWVEGAGDEEVAQWYAASDIFCVPSREAADDVEGFGIVFLEAAAAGLPVVAGRGWGTEEAVLDGQTGLLVSPDKEHVTQALLKLMEDRALGLRMGQAGQERVQRDFRWEDRWNSLVSFLGIDEKENGGEVCRGRESDISVVIPCYNHAAELGKALASLTKQTLRPKEIIVVDNMSDDGPAEVVSKFEAELPVRMVRCEKRGAPAARNYGANLTSGRFIIFMDADVELAPTALERMMNALESSQAEFAYSDFRWGSKLFRGRDWDPQALRNNNWIHTTSLIRREAVLPFDEGLKRFQDWDLWLRMAESDKKGVWIPETLFRVTERKSGGISRWLPAFVHHMPWPILGWMPKEVRRYREAKEVIVKKHGLDSGPLPVMTKKKL